MGNFSGNGNQNTAWGILFRNSTSETISEISISYTGEQWRRAESNLDTLHFSYQISALEINDLAPAAGAVPAAWPPKTNLSFQSPLAPGSPPFFTASEVDNEENINGTIAVNVPTGHYLALRWYDEDIAGNDAALGIDNLTVSFAAAAVPEPTAFLFSSLVCCALGTTRRRTKRKIT